MVLEVVRRSQGYWENLVLLVVSRNSLFGSANVLDAFVAGLAELMAENPNTPLRETDEIRGAVRRLSAISASRELGVLEFGEIFDLITDVIRKRHSGAVS